MCSYVMWPIAFIIGIDTDECQESAKLIGLKVFATEVLAYQELGKSVDAGLLNVRLLYDRGSCCLDLARLRLFRFV